MNGRSGVHLGDWVAGRYMVLVPEVSTMCYSVAARVPGEVLKFKLPIRNLFQFRGEAGSRRLFCNFSATSSHVGCL